MKKTLFIAILLVVTLMGSSAFAQKQMKFGHIDSNQLLSIMPEREKAKVDLEKYAKQLETTLTAMQTEFEKKYQDYIATADSLSPLLRQTKEGELGEMQQRIQKFQQTAQQDLGEKENTLLQPIIAKARDAINLVSEEGGYLYVFDIGAGVVLYHSADSEDILPLVKVKLGIQ
jgi:outer membrane protein